MAITVPAYGRDGRVEERALPFVIGVIGDFSGTPDAERPPLRERHFVSVDRRSLDDLIGAAAPPGETLDRQVESAWLGVRHLVSGLEPRSNLRIKLVDVSKKELRKDLARALEPEKSWLYRRLAEEAYPTRECEPFSMLICDYEFTSNPGDVGLLSGLSRIAAALLAPMIAAVGPGMFHFDDYRELQELRRPEQRFVAPDYAPWRSLRDSDDSRYLVLTLPRVMVRRSHERGFDFEALAGAGPDGACWMNAAYLLGGRLAEVFSAEAWWTTLDGREALLSLGEMPSQGAGDGHEGPQRYGPGQVPITLAQAERLSRVGFAALYGEDNPCAFIMAQTVCRPRRCEDPDAAEAAEIETRIVNVMAPARIAQHVRKAAVHFSIQAGSRETLERRLKDWIGQHLCEPGETGAPEDHRRWPLNGANIELLDHIQAADQCLVRLWLRPNLPGQAPFDTVNNRIVFTLPTVHLPEA